MAVSWGVDPVVSGGVVTTGTTAADFRKIQGGLYSPGLISGGTVTRNASGMTYTVATGVAAFPIVTSGTIETVLGPIPSKVLSTVAPVSGTRLDMIYAQQRLISAEGDPNIDIFIGTTLPARSVLLDAYLVTSTTTNTLSTVRQVDIKYSIPYGASLGLLVNRKSAFNGNFTISANDLSGPFYLPTDRTIRVSVQSGLSSSGAVGFDNSKYCEAGYDVYIDEVKRFAWTSQGLHQAWAETYWSDTITLTAGAHTYRTVRYRVAGPGTCVARGGAILQIQDVGPVA